MGRDLILYPFDHLLEKDLPKACVIPSTELYCDRGGGDFLRQVGIYEDIGKEDDSEPDQVIFPRLVPESAHFYFHHDAERCDTPTREDRIGPLKYATAKEFAVVDKSRVDGVRNLAALNYILTLPQDSVVIIWTS